MNTHAILEVKNFSKLFFLHEQGKAIPSSHGVNIMVYPGKLTALTGPTGAGKSSVLNGIYRTYLPSSGEILYRRGNGEVIDLAMADEHSIIDLRRREIGFVTQFLRALPRQSTLDVVVQPLYRLGVDRQQARQQARDLLSALNLPERLWEISPATFSGGEKQRVNLARGLIAKPRLLLLDEPTASLDSNTAESVIDLLQQLKQQGIAMLAIFHHPELVTRLADEVVAIDSAAATENSIKENVL